MSFGQAASSRPRNLVKDSHINPGLERPNRSKGSVMHTTKIHTAKTYLTRISRSASLFTACFFLTALGCHTSQAYDTYTDGCNTCHGNFRDATTTKGTIFPGGKNHDMHRLTSSFPNNMATACNLCHIGARQNTRQHLAIDRHRQQPRDRLLGMP